MLLDEGEGRESKSQLKPNINKTKIMAYPAPLLDVKQNGESGSSDRFPFHGL